MIKLVVRVVGTNPRTKEDVDLSESRSDDYDLKRVQVDMERVLVEAAERAFALAGRSLKEFAPQLQVLLTADEGEVRPSLHLSEGVIRRLAESGAFLDFDPYV